MVCSICKQDGHNVRSCPTSKTPNLAAAAAAAVAALKPASTPLKTLGQVRAEKAAAAPAPVAAPNPEMEAMRAQMNALTEMMKQMMAAQASDGASVCSSASNTSESCNSNMGVDLDYTLRFALTQLYTRGPDGIAYEMLKTIYRLKPELFKIQGTIHNDISGSRTYFSVRIFREETSFYDTLHIYGAVRFSKFMVQSATYRKCGKEANEIAWTFNRHETSS